MNAQRFGIWFLAFLVILVILANTVVPVAGDPVQQIHLPMIAREASPIIVANLILELSTATVPAGQVVLLNARTVNYLGNTIYDPELYVTASITGRSHAAADTINLASHGNGIYTGEYIQTGSGNYQVVARAYRDVKQEDTPYQDRAALRVDPGPMVGINVLRSSEQSVSLWGHDEYQNPVKHPDPAMIVCTSTNPDLFVLPAQPDPFFPEYGLMYRLEGMDYGTGGMQCVYLPTASMEIVEVANPPVELVFPGPMEMDGTGWMVESFFDVFVEINLPVGPEGWIRSVGTVRYPLAPGVEFTGCHVFDPGMYTVTCVMVPDGAGNMLLNFDLNYLPGAPGVIGTVMPFSIVFSTPASTDIIPFELKITNFQHYDATMSPILYDPNPYLGLWWLYPLTIKPVKTLIMHVYVVEGEATPGEVQQDVDAAEAGFNLNAALCICGFYIDFAVIITYIPRSDWDQIDPDGDGLDDEEMAKAREMGYFDDSTNTENVYYFPGFSDGSLGATFPPDGQVVVDNGEDTDNLTLFHEKVHELDLRADGDFDVLDSPDDEGNNQGARNPGNIMNYDHTGVLMTPAQCQFLDP